MKKYILMYCQEREMSVHGVFSSLPDAQNAMKKEFCDYHMVDCRMSKEDFSERYDGEIDNLLSDTPSVPFVDFEAEDCGMSRMSAWSNVQSSFNVDWQIQEVEIEEETKGIAEQMMESWRLAQNAGIWLPCPRCGCLSMKRDVRTNALSRCADVYVCDDCGDFEALEVAKSGATKRSIDNWFIGSFE